MSKKGKVFIHNIFAGIIEETDEGTYLFFYDVKYLERPHAPAVSLCLPLRSEPYNSKVLFPFFDGLIPEGWLLEIVTKNWKVNPRDRMSLLLLACADCIGAVHVLPEDK